MGMVKVIKEPTDPTKNYEVDEEEAKRLSEEGKIRWSDDLGCYVENPTWSMT